MVQDDEKWSSEREVNPRVMLTSGDDQGEPQRPDRYCNKKRVHLLNKGGLYKMNQTKNMY